MKKTSLILLGLLLDGCAPMAPHYGSDLSKLQQVKLVKLQTTEQELLNYFGTPHSTLSQADVAKTLSWTDVRQDAGMRTVGLLMMIPGSQGKVTATTTSLNATVKDGVLIDYTVSDSNSSMDL